MRFIVGCGALNTEMSRAVVQICFPSTRMMLVSSVSEIHGNPSLVNKLGFE